MEMEKTMSFGKTKAKQKLFKAYKAGDEGRYLLFFDFLDCISPQEYKKLIKRV